MRNKRPVSLFGQRLLRFCRMRNTPGGVYEEYPYLVIGAFFLSTVLPAICFNNVRRLISRNDLILEASFGEAYCIGDLWEQERRWEERINPS